MLPHQFTKYSADLKRGKVLPTDFLSFHAPSCCCAGTRSRDDDTALQGRTHILQRLGVFCSCGAHWEWKAFLIPFQRGDDSSWWYYTWRECESALKLDMPILPSLVL